MGKLVQVQLVTDGEWVEVEVPNFYEPEKHHKIRFGANDKRPFVKMKLGNGRIYDKITGQWATEDKPKPDVLYKLNLGCGDDKIEGWVNIDQIESADLRLDLEEAELPFQDESVEEVYASHVMEHLHNFPALMNEIHRVLMPNGVVEIKVPMYPHKEAFGDPTHVRFFTDVTMSYFHEGSHFWYNTGKNYGYKPFRHIIQSLNGFELRILLRK